ncbi:MAG: OmpA family protein, partial [Proteobacteria bacterium]|nr:OmpA family protein [Pseudomonadota bacterium]
GVVIEAVDGDGLLFDVSSAKLGEPLERFLRALAPMAGAAGAPIEIYGHTDARPFAPGSTMSNWDLSYARAAAARAVLEDSGVAHELIRSVNARGSSDLYVKDDPLAAANRRLSIVLKIAKVADTHPAELVQPGIITGSP